MFATVPGSGTRLLQLQKIRLSKNGLNFLCARLKIYEHMILGQILIIENIKYWPVQDSNAFNLLSFQQAKRNSTEYFAKEKVVALAFTITGRKRTENRFSCMKNLVDIESVQSSSALCQRYGTL